MGTQSETFPLSTKSMAMVDFEAVYQAELPRVYNFFRYRVGDDQVAEDLTAATFEKAWRNRERYRADIASFSTWLFVLARRVATDYFRKHRTASPLDDSIPATDLPSVEDMAQERAEFAQLSMLLARLADRGRELVALKYGAGLTNRDIARLTGLSETNVSTILSRVTQQLRAQWKDEP